MFKTSSSNLNTRFLFYVSQTRIFNFSEILLNLLAIVSWGFHPQLPSSAFQKAAEINPN